MRLLLLISIACFFSGFNAPPKKVRITIKFVHIANGRTLEQDGIYTNPFGENYSVSQLKYYVSNFTLTEQNETENPGKNINLVNAFGNDSMRIETSPGAKLMASFMLGVDSIYNCSGAQSGALDPLNGMFWTWNTGYIFFKLEGSSAVSTANRQRIEHHIGGYTGPNKAMRMITMPVSFYAIENGVLRIEMNLDNYWYGNSTLKILAYPTITAPGEMAKKAADNFDKIWSSPLEVYPD
ncbi:MAG: MbnP family protein [Ferruginibacter sp.]